MCNLNEENNIRYQITEYKDKKIWVTRKARINGEKRMLRYNLYTFALLSIYSFILIAISIIELNTDISASYLPIIFSIAIFGLSIFIPSMNYIEKANLFKKSYLELHTLEIELEQLSLTDDSGLNTDLLQKFYDIKVKYVNTLDKTLNHSDMDYITVQIQANGFHTLDLLGWYRLIKHLLLSMLISGSLIIFPIILLWGVFFR